MQTSTNKIESMAFMIESEPPVPKDFLGGFRVYRSPIQTKYVNVVAVDKQERMLAVVAADLTVDEGMQLAEMLNEEYQITQQQPQV